MTTLLFLFLMPCLFVPIFVMVKENLLPEW